MLRRLSFNTSMRVAAQRCRGRSFIARRPFAAPPRAMSRHFSTASSSSEPDAASLRTILDEPTRQLVDKEKQLLTKLCNDLKKSDYAGDEDIVLLQDVLSQLNELFMLVVVGEFNSGKSSFINTLLGKCFTIFVFACCFVSAC